eukprot:gnl/TRDRNA2_/TRDRNA2_178029_c5_seq4.p1 gnl/TRDRNA2_/TRDRNA2_178029_c5~~gnl/TRDRNA2_/TRDRNA2_178029_c5_seq4.p1  ORF type:complete len:164 (-),score=39.45 gnl/TRDRNA2_/TRDRNA2_178029_c5_seq4:358-849(-)
MENVNEWYGLFFVLYRCTFIFSLTRIMGAVFVSETMRVAQNDHDLQIAKKNMAKEHLLKELQHVFEELDASGDGQLSWKEFEVLLNDNLMKTWLQTLEVDVSDVMRLFKLLDDGRGQIEHDKFISGIRRAMGTAKSIDMVELHHIGYQISAKLDAVLRKEVPL